MYINYIFKKTFSLIIFTFFSIECSQALSFSNVQRLICKNSRYLVGFASGVLITYFVPAVVKAIKRNLKYTEVCSSKKNYLERISLLYGSTF